MNWLRRLAMLPSCLYPVPAHQQSPWSAGLLFDSLAAALCVGYGSLLKLLILAV